MGRLMSGQRTESLETRPGEGQMVTGQAGKGEAGAPAMPDFDRLAQNLARLVEQGGRALAAYFKPSDETGKTDVSDQVADAVRSIGYVAEHWLSEPARAFEAQSSLLAKFIGLWAHTLKRMTGEKEGP